VYQDLVESRYSDKLPGSQYNESGMAGGYSDSAPIAASTPAPYNDYTLPVAAGSAVLLLSVLFYARYRKPKTHS
jgi:hypothetical protein